MLPGRRLAADARSRHTVDAGVQPRWQRHSPAAALPRSANSLAAAAQQLLTDRGFVQSHHVPCRPHSRRVVMADSKQASHGQAPLPPVAAAAAGAPAVLDSSSSSSSSSNGASPPSAAAAAASGGATITRSPSTLATAANGTLEEGYEGILPQQQASDGLFVRVRGMFKHYNTPKGIFRAVDGVDVDIEPGSIVALLGPSGSGKTTLLRLIAGLEVPTGGKILFDDLDATDLAVQDRMVGMVFQSYALFNHMTVSENIKFGLQVRRLPVDHSQRAADLLELVQLSGLGDRYPRQLSGGQRQRVALARALAASPRLLLLDEPFGALDAVVRRQLRAGLKDIVRTVGVTTVIVTHDQEEAFDLADKVVIFNRGLVEQQGSPTDIIRRPRTPFVMKFVGETNAVPSTCLLVRRSGYMTKKPQVLFRPSDIQLFTEYKESVDGGHSVTPATVTEKFNLGWVVKYVLRFDDDVAVELGVSRKEADGPLKLDVGQRIYLYVPPGNMMGFEPAEVDSAPLV